MTAGQQMLQAGGRTIGGFSVFVEDNTLSPANALATVTMNAAGTITFSGDAMVPPVANWANPPAAGIGASYWVRCTVTSGVLTGGSGTGVWLSCNTNPTWQRNATTTSGFQTANITLDFSSDAAGSVIVGTGTATLRALKDV